MRSSVRLCEAPVLLDLRRPIDIEDLLIWTYRDQKAHIVLGRGEGLHEGERTLDGVSTYQRSACGVAQMIRIGELGWRVDGGGPSADHLHEDAETVHRAVRPELLPQMIHHATVGDRPDWMPGAAPRFQIVMGGRGRPRVFHEAWDAGKRYGHCQIDWTFNLARIEMMRMEYRRWWIEIARLAVLLRDNLTAWNVTAPAASSEPWLLHEKRLDVRRNA